MGIDGSVTHPLLGRAYRGAEWAAAAMFAVMLTAFMVQVISRYVFNAPVAWSLEVASIAYVWVVFWACGLLVGERQQIVFDVVYNALPARPRLAVAVFNTACLGLVFLAGLPGTIDWLIFIGRRKTMMLRLPLDVVYSCFAIFMVAVIVAAAVRLRRLAGANWRAEL